MPVVWDEKKEREKVSAKEVLTRNELKQFHGDLDNFLKKEIPEIYREGVLNGETIGLDSVKDIKKYSKEIQERKDELAKDLKTFKEPKVVLDKIDKTVKKSIFGDKITLSSSDYEKLKVLSVSGIKLKSELDKTKTAAKSDKTEIKDLKKRNSEIDQLLGKYQVEAKEYGANLEQSVSLSKRLNENQIVYKSMLKDTNRDIDIGRVEKAGRIIIDKIENNKMPKDVVMAEKWLGILEENKRAETIPLNRIESILDRIKDFIDRLLGRQNQFSLEGVKSKDNELKREDTPKKTKSKGMEL